MDTHKNAPSDAVHVCIDDASRIAFSQVMKNEKKGCAVAFLKAAVAYYVSLGITVERVMTDNGACYKSIAFRKPASVFASSTSAPGPIRPRPRQGRALHPNQLARMGLCPSLQHLERTRCRAAKMAPSLQFAPSSWQSRSSRPSAHSAMLGNNLLRLHASEILVLTRFLPQISLRNLRKLRFAYANRYPLRSKTL